VKVTPEYLDGKIYQLLEMATSEAHRRPMREGLDAMQFTQAAQNVVICKHNLQEIENRNKSESKLYSVEEYEHS
jgi:hypothetical protein